MNRRLASNGTLVPSAPRIQRIPARQGARGRGRHEVQRSDTGTAYALLVIDLEVVRLRQLPGIPLR